MLKEYRITLPISVEEYRIGQLYSVAQSSKNYTNGEEGVEVVKNEEFVDNPLFDGRFCSGQYTYKIYHLASHAPQIVRLLIPKNTLSVHEEAWNAYPYCRTILTNPGFSKDKYKIVIETLHLPDRGDSDNVHCLTDEEWESCEIIKIDIANDHISQKDYKTEEDPRRFKSEKTGRGPLGDRWQETVEPVMTCYKLVKADFQWFGFQNRVENWIHTAERGLFLQFHRQLFCNMDAWYGLTIEDIRNIEDETKRELEKRLEGSKEISM